MEYGTPPLVLVSHALCPYVQRAAITLIEKATSFERRDIDLVNKPDWFLAVSPLGKTPLLVVGDTAIFESAVICEYLDDTIAPRMHPDDPLARAQHRAWIEFASAILNTIAGFYNAPDVETLGAKQRELRAKFGQVEAATGKAPFFAGSRFTLVDAAFAPVFRYFETFDAIDDFGFFNDTPKLRAWRAALADRASVRGAAPADYRLRLERFLRARGSELSRRMSAHELA